MPDATLDPTMLAKLRKLGGDQLVTALVESFLAEAPARRATLAGEDPEAMAQVAHLLVAGAGQLGAAALAGEAKALEEAFRRQDRTTVLRLAEPLLTTYDEALAALRRYQETA